MSDLQKCPKCGGELPKDAPAGLCPKCLVAAGLESEAGGRTSQPKSDPEAPTVDNPSPGSGFLPPTPAELADKFPQLEIVELLGHGGMGAVYKARQTNLDRLVALKIIRPEATHDPTFAERFNREAKTLARLNHQQIVAVYDFGEVEVTSCSDGLSRPLYFFLMEYVDGANLRQLMRAGDLVPEQALAIVPQICNALQYAHDEGVVHRDIKPENILLDKRGRVKIADFGLAKLTTPSEAECTLTGTHQVMGTLRYMAPEQLEGSHSVDHRADIYSLGVVFYEMLTGEVPMGHFDPPSNKVQIDVRLDEVVLRTLARDPERRYQHASEVKTDVDSIGLTSPVIGRPTAPNGLAGWFPGWQTYAAALFTVCLILPIVVNGVTVSGLNVPLVILFTGGVAGLTLLAWIRDLVPLAPNHSWTLSRIWLAGLTIQLVMLVGGHELLQEHNLFTLGKVFDHPSNKVDLLLLRFLRFAIFFWTFYFTAGWLWVMRQRHLPNGKDLAKTGGPRPTNRTQHPFASEVMPSANDEQQREAELAEIAPDWLCWPILGLFAAGWIVVDLLWNLRWPGLIVAIGVMTAITYYVVQLRLRYMPKLRQELQREPRWSRVTSLGSALVMFVLGMLCVVWFQATIGELLINTQLYGSPSGLGFNLLTDKQLATFVKAANFEGLNDTDVGLVSAGWGSRDTVSNLLLSASWAVCLLFFSVTSIIHTRRYRFTWKHWWQPSIAITFYLLGTLIVVHVLHLFISGGHAESRTDPRQFHVAAGWDAVDAALDNWKRQTGYVQPSYENWKAKRTGSNSAHYTPSI